MFANKRNRSKKTSRSEHTRYDDLLGPTELDEHYFKNNHLKVRLPPAPKAGEGFRRAQLAAIHAIGLHGLTRSDPGLVVMPTGSGKTAVLIMAGYVLQAKRILVITPSRLLRSQVVEQFASLAVLRKLGAIDPTFPCPIVHEQTELADSAEAWEAFRKSNVVVAIPNSISPSIQGVATPPSELFDLLLVDEAHHQPAPAWNALIEAFPKARVLLFTATPFRRDKQRLHGSLAYSYPMREAFADKVFGKIEYHPVEVTGSSSSRDLTAEDKAIAANAEAVVRADQKAGLTHKVLVRVDSLSRARELAKLYSRETKLRLGVVHSRLTYARVKRAIADLKAGKLDGVVCVNMLGEGFDFPELKVAAIHSPHKSLAVTLQFIGRFARVGGEKLGTAKFLAVPSEVRVGRELLYKEDAVWQEIILHLHAHAVDAETESRKVVQSFGTPKVFDPSVETLSLHSLHPRFHAKVFSVPDGADIHGAVELPKPFEIVYRQDNADRHVTVMVAADRQRAKWCSNTALARLEYDLVIVYHHEASKLLFINASRSNDSLYEAIGAGIAGGSFRILPLYKVNRVLHNVSQIKCSSVGMKNRVSSANTESYRIITGSNAQQALRSTDGQLFHRGHISCSGMEGSKPVTLGYSSSSKLWSMSKGSLAELLAWCEALAQKIGNEKAIVSVPGVEHLPVGEPLTDLPVGLLGADWDAMAYDRPPAAMYKVGKKREVCSLIDFDLHIDHQHSDKKRIRVEVRCASQTWLVDFRPKDGKLFAYAAGSPRGLQLERGREVSDFVDYLNNNPLNFYFADFSRVRGEERFPCPVTLDPFDRSRIQVIDWVAENVDIQREFGKKGAKLSIHDYLAKTLDDPTQAIVLYDHGSGEMADFVTVQEANDHIDVRLYHCKGSGGAAPGNRVGDIYEVCGQVIKSFHWLHNAPGAVARIRKRVQGTSKFIRGDITLFDRLLRGVGGKRRAYTIVAVQPGITKGGLSDQCASVLSAASEYCRRVGAEDLLVLGSA